MCRSWPRQRFHGSSWGAVSIHTDWESQPAGVDSSAAADRPSEGEAGQGSAAGGGAAPAAGQPAAAGGVADSRGPAAQVHRVVLQHHRQEAVTRPPPSRGPRGSPESLHSRQHVVSRCASGPS